MSVKRRIKSKVWARNPGFERPSLGLSNKEVTKKTISTLTKNKKSYFAALEQSSTKRKKLRDSDHERLDHAVFK